MNIKSLLLGSAAALVAVSGARAADAIVADEPEPAEYGRVCDAFGTGFFYIPGTETCLKINGYVWYQSITNLGDDTVAEGGTGFSIAADDGWNKSPGSEITKLTRSCGCGKSRPMATR